MGEIRVKTADSWLTLPSHEKTADGWKDIPTHIMTANGWQGELTSQSPLEFRSTGQSLLDWRIDGRTSKNRFDISSDIHGYINSSGNFVPNNFYTATDYIEIPPNARTLYCSAITKSGQPVYTGLHVAVYDENKTLLTYDMDYNKSKISISVDISLGKYFRADVCSEDYTECMVSFENVPYEPYGGVGDWDETEQQYKIPVNVRGENLYSGAWEQGFWAYSDGVSWDGDSKYVRTAKMLCKGNIKYEFVCSLPDGSKDYGFVFWDANGNFIGDTHSSDVQNTPVEYSTTSPANARIMAVNIARYSDGERHPADILSFDLYEQHETNLYTDHQLMDGDSMNYTTDQTSIPITQGDNTLTVGTAVQPSKVFVKFEG